MKIILCGACGRMGKNVAETAAELLVVEVLFLEDLDRDMPVFQQIVGLEYDGHAAEPNEL